MVERRNILLMLANKTLKDIIRVNKHITAIVKVFATDDTNTWTT